LCDNSTSSRSQFDYSLDISLAEVLGKPHLCCARTPIGWGEDEYTGQSILEILKQVYCRTVTHFADFVTSCPELSLLEERDRLSLCSTNYCGIVLLMLVYNAYERGCDGILFPHGFKYSLSKSHRREDHEFNEFLHELVEYLHRNVAQTFRAINITVEEYSILKTILLFSGVITLTDAGTETVHRARRKYTSLLSEYVMMTRSDLTSEEKMERLAKLFDIIPLMLRFIDEN
uniref:NR LBD domain-containing protein n=1 Tax=Nippostrongylus brasiliensis TaxID=27835 RepID=A0A0N4YVD4_NIPBR